jgi:hypothetical protein
VENNLGGRVNSRCCRAGFFICELFQRRDMNPALRKSRGCFAKNNLKITSGEDGSLQRGYYAVFKVLRNKRSRMILEHYF